MEDSTNNKIRIEAFIAPIINTAIKVITNPLGFFKNMAKSGGFIEPLIFIVAMGIVSGILQAVLAVLGFVRGVPFSMALASIIIAPVLMAVFGFAVAFVLFIIWKIMGSQEPYETAFRCNAYVASITPINTVLAVIPYIGPVLGFVWMMYLIILASIEVHKIKPKIAGIVFGVICAILSISAITSQFAARKMINETEKWQDRYEKELQGVRPEEAGKAAEEYLKRLQEEAGKK
jgi:hypothetical protein